MSEAPVRGSFETTLLAEGVITSAQLDRATRIAGRLRRHARVADVLVEIGQLARAEYDRVMRRYRSSLSIGRILHEDGVLDDVGVLAYEEARRDGPHLSEREALVGAGLVSEEQFLRALASRHDIPFVQPDVSLVDAALLARASWPYLVRHLALPLRIVEGQLNAILADPLDQQVLGELERIYDVPVRACCAPADAIRDALRTLENMREGTARPASSGVQYCEVRDLSDDDSEGESAVAIVDHLLMRALQMRASDLHIEPQEHRVRVRARVDGVLEHITDLPASFAPQVTSRVKVLAGADIAERRLHQDGRIAVRVEDRAVDIRVSSYVSVWGETLVMRLLDRRRGLVPLEELGFEPRVLGQLRELALRSASGLVLVTGPTGSGKTTSLYSFVDYLNAPGVKVITCEDPVEYVLEGVTQCSTNPKSGPTFPDSLKAIVRQDPDIIVVGEVRDPETAKLAVECALTGHQVLSSLHTEDSVGAAMRLADMGVEAFLVASTLSAVIAQRLVRKTCASCRRPAEASREDLRFFGLDRADLAGLPLVEGAGCPECNGTGYRGRVGLYELLMPDDDFRDALLQRAPSRELRRLARRVPPFMTLQEAGLLKAASGATTLGEVAANAPRDPNPRRPAELFELGGGRNLA